ncbi:Hypothetical protein FKW44_011338 [Caligus rogercresseyi]|uniref:Uncharacterized protein n=1 Tax=Caligus rogercresseyi TaxID=217165 RepID=A0A7T8HI54_CALRO|nr:Hypothetical protein FKW44_011338 [Caligus rogercresseyi]
MSKQESNREKLFSFAPRGSHPRKGCRDHWRLCPHCFTTVEGMSMLVREPLGLKEVEGIIKKRTRDLLDDIRPRLLRILNRR